MNVEFAELSLPGHRQQNQDRVRVFNANGSWLLVVVDGMGGHAEGERAAEAAVRTLEVQFRDASKPLLDPQGFLTLGLARAHDAVVALGASVSMDHRPRATCAVCLVQDDCAYWAHVGDSRVYQLRSGGLVGRTRDHSHVELLLREGLIAPKDARNHPMRNYVECCLGGDTSLPEMSVTACRRLAQGDLLLLCTDGLWSGIEEHELAQVLADGSRALGDELKELGDRAVARNAPHSDNTSAVALRWRTA